MHVVRHFCFETLTHNFYLGCVARWLLHVRLDQCQMKRSDTIKMGGIEISTVTNQLLYHGHITLVDSSEQRRQTVFSASIKITRWLIKNGNGFV